MVTTKPRLERLLSFACFFSFLDLIFKFCSIRGKVGLRFSFWLRFGVRHKILPEIRTKRGATAVAILVLLGLRQSSFCSKSAFYSEPQFPQLKQNGKIVGSPIQETPKTSARKKRDCRVAI